MHYLRLLIALNICLGKINFAHADFEEEFRAASVVISGVKDDAEELVVEGRLDEANQKLLSAFPDATRTAVQAYLLGNVLYEMDPKTSYALHQRAAKEITNQPNVDLEWALQQHRAREYAGAAESYAKFLDANPNYAPVHGLVAECLLRQGKTDEAVEAWRRSESAGRGTLERFESLVCDVNRHTFPGRERADLIVQVRKGDITAAEKLISLDCHYEIDWWNRVTRVSYLEHDLQLVRSLNFPDEDRKRAALCAGECALAVEKEEGDVAEILRKAGYLLDAGKTLPQSGAIFECMLRSALSAKAIKSEQAQTNWADAVLDQAQRQKDPILFNVAAFLTVGDPRLEKAQQLGWDLTSDQRCAVGRIISLAGTDKLTLEHPLFIKAVRQFPEEPILAGLVVSLKAKAGQPLEADLIRAIKAEYSHFSFHSQLSMRPHANGLRSYFRALQEERAKQQPKG